MNFGWNDDGIGSCLKGDIIRLVNEGKRFAKKYQYSNLLLMLGKINPVLALKQYLQIEMNGHYYDYTKYYLNGCENLLLEYLVISPKYSFLFTREEVAFCEQFFLERAA